MAMSSLDRVKAALAHQESDRVPFDLGGSGVTGINIKSLSRLRAYLGLSTNEIKIYDTVSQLGVVEDDLVDPPVSR